jgi:hypothetical protein
VFKLDSYFYYDQPKLQRAAVSSGADIGDLIDRLISYQPRKSRTRLEPPEGVLTPHCTCLTYNLLQESKPKQRLQ